MLTAITIILIPDEDSCAAFVEHFLSVHKNFISFIFFLSLPGKPFGDELYLVKGIGFVTYHG